MKLHQITLLVLSCNMLSPFIHGAEEYNDRVLIDSVRAGNKKGVEQMLAAGANANCQDEEGHPALYVAILADCPEIMGMLLEAGADVNYQDHNGCSFFQLGIEGTSPDIIGMLLAAGANVNHQNNCGFTPLITAIRCNSLEKVRLLLAVGADVNHQSDYGVTSLSQALGISSMQTGKLRYSEITKILVGVGARPTNEQFSRLSLEAQELVMQRRDLVQQWLKNLEEKARLPRDLSRLVGKFAGLSEEEMLPKPACGTYQK